MTTSSDSPGRGFRSLTARLIVWTLSKALEALDPDVAGMDRILRRLVPSSPDVWGAAIALEPGAAPGRAGHFAPSLFEVVAAREGDPGVILGAANHNLCSQNEAGMFVTAVCGSLDLETGELGFAVAGTDPRYLGWRG